jgi:NADPH-dependent 2,4-dienoyl-CoA reductase/sulfur reductase-like enzyme
MSARPTHVIVGASLAGATAAAELREQGFEGRVVLVGSEPELPYERPPLSKDYLRGEVARESAQVHPAEFYERHDVELRLGEEPYDAVPYVFSDQYDVGMEYSGHALGDDEVVFRGDPATREFIAFWLRQGRVVAGMNVNVWDVSDQIQALIRSGHTVDLARLRDPDVPLPDLAPVLGQ